MLQILSTICEFFILRNIKKKKCETEHLASKQVHTRQFRQMTYI